MGIHILWFRVNLNLYNLVFLGLELRTCMIVFPRHTSMAIYSIIYFLIFLLVEVYIKTNKVGF